MQIETLPPTSPNGLNGRSSTGQTVQCVSGSTKEVLLSSLLSRLSRTRTIGLAANSIVQGVMRSALQPRALVMSLVAVFFTQDHLHLSEESVSHTEDGGVILEFASAATAREVLYAVPEDGRTMYFAASGDGPRKAGIVDGPFGVRKLTDWLGGSGFPTEDVKLG